MAQIGPGGALFGKGDGPSLRDLFVQNQQEQRFDQREATRKAEEQKKENAKSSFLLNKTWDPSKVATGTPNDEAITHYMQSKREEYAKLQKESGLSASEMAGIMQQDLIPVSQYLQNAKMFNAGIQKKYAEYEKQGIKSKDVDKALRERLFFDKDESGKLTPKKFEDVDWNIDGALEQVFAEDVDKIGVNQSIATKDITARPLSSLAGETYSNNTPNAGWAVKQREKGVASFDPLFHNVNVDRSGVITGVDLRTRKFTNDDGSPFINKETGKEAEDVLTDDAFEYVYENAPASRKLMIDKAARKRASEVKAKGGEVTDADMDYFRRSEATKILETNAKSKFSSVNGTSRTFRRPEKVKAASTKIEEVIDFEVAPRTSDGGYDVTGQTNYIDLGKDNFGRPIKSERNIVYDDGSMKIEYREKDRFGVANGPTKDYTLNPTEAEQFLKANKSRPGNKKPTEKILKAITGGKKTEGATPEQKPAAPSSKEAPKKFKGTNKKMF